jgi:SIR2-like domain
MVSEATAIERLKTAFRRNSLTLYLGAGASAGSGVPVWSDLVLTAYLNSVRIPGDHNSSFPGLLSAVLVRRFAQDRVPLEVATRQLRGSFDDPAEFLSWVRFGLYQWLEFDSRGYPTGQVQSLIRENTTLMAIVRLCQNTEPNKAGLRAVVTYNLDGLLEMALGSYPFQAIWKETRLRSGKLPIYHAHGYLPVKDPFRSYSETLGSAPDEIVLTEDQYNREAANPYSWSNLVQLQTMSNSVGLMIGLSLSDRNIRRLLDVAARAAYKPEIYALLPKPTTPPLSESDVLEIAGIHEERLASMDRYRKSPLPRPDFESKTWRKAVEQLWRRVDHINLRRQLSVLRELGVEPIWCQHADIPSMAERIVRA